MIPFQKSEYSRTFQVTGVNQNARRLLSTDLVNIKEAERYIFLTSARLVLSQLFCLRFN